MFTGFIYLEEETKFRVVAAVVCAVVILLVLASLWSYYQPVAMPQHEGKWADVADGTMDEVFLASTPETTLAMIVNTTAKNSEGAE